MKSLRVFDRGDDVVAINPEHVVAVYPSTIAGKTCIVTTALTSFSASSGSTTFVVDLDFEATVSRLN